MSNPRQTTPLIERILVAVFVLGVVVSVGTFFAIMIATALGSGANNGFSAQPWPLVFMIPYVMLPIAMLALIALFVVNRRQRNSLRDSSD